MERGNEEGRTKGRGAIEIGSTVTHEALTRSELGSKSRKERKKEASARTAENTRERPTDGRTDPLKPPLLRKPSSDSAGRTEEEYTSVQANLYTHKQDIKCEIYDSYDA